MFLGKNGRANKIRRSNFGKVFAHRPRAAGGRMIHGKWSSTSHLSGLGLVGVGTIVPPNEAGKGGSFIDSIASIFQTAIPAYSQYRLMKTNEGLIREGRAPIDPASIAPTVRVQAGIDPGATSMVKMAMVGTGVLLGGFLLMRVLKR